MRKSSSSGAAVMNSANRSSVSAVNLSVARITSRREVKSELSIALGVGLPQVFRQPGQHEDELVGVHHLQVPPLQDKLVARVSLIPKAAEGAKLGLLGLRSGEIFLGDQ